MKLSGVAIIIGITINITNLLAQDADTTLINYQLGEVRIVSSREIQPDFLESKHLTEKDNLADEIGKLPGMQLANFGSRSESTIYFRGSDLRSIPVYVDGIPLTAAYDGYVDLGRLGLNNISGGYISKGFIPVNFLSNASAGAINLVSYTPEDKLELSAQAELGSGNYKSGFFRAGSKIDKFYASGSLYYSSRDYFPLSGDYDSTGRVIDESDGKRNNSWQNDFNGNIKIGFIPKAYNEFSLNYIFHNSSKGTPPYIGFDSNQRTRYWQWPTWKKNSLFFLSRIRTGKQSYLKFRAFYDDFYNVLDSYDDANYNSMTRGYAFTSIYDDYSYGINSAFIFKILPGNSTKFFGQLINDHHSEYNEGETPGNFDDLNYSFGLENKTKIIEELALHFNIAYTGRQAISAEDFSPADGTITELDLTHSKGLSGQTMLRYSLRDNQNIDLSASRRARFPTMKERYSYRAGTGLPNPYLRTEITNEIDLSYLFNSESLMLSSSLFYAFLEDAILTVQDQSTGLYMAENAGKAEKFGLEINSELQATAWLGVYFRYNFIQLSNVSDPDVFFVHIPKHSIAATIDISPIDKFDITSTYQYLSQRYSTSYGIIAPAFNKIDIQLSYLPVRSLKLTLGIYNIFDDYYELSEGFPEFGRSFRLRINLSI